MKTIIIYWSATGNTKKVADKIHETLAKNEINAEIKTVKECADIDLFDYDLVFIGAPSYMWSPPDPVLNWLKDRMGFYHKEGIIKLGAPQVPGKKAVVFITYSGPHTGIDEAIPAGSKAVLNAISKYQPMLGLHGHIHESRGIQKIGRTLCINPGSEYSEGILRGVIVILRKNKIKDYMFVSG